MRQEPLALKTKCSILLCTNDVIFHRADRACFDFNFLAAALITCVHLWLIRVDRRDRHQIRIFMWPSEPNFRAPSNQSVVVARVQLLQIDWLLLKVVRAELILGERRLIVTSGARENTWNCQQSANQRLQPCNLHKLENGKC